MNIDFFKRTVLILISAILLAAIPSITLTGCNSTTTTTPDAPREFFGVMKYTGPTYAIFYVESPYKYAFYNINDEFIAYLDTSKVVANDFESLSGKSVFVKGILKKIDGENVIIAEKLRFSRL